MSELSDRQVVKSWLANAAPWTEAVRNDEIESRRLVTNAAIVDVITERHPASALDIGCGEGWLSRALAGRGIDVVGTDVVPALIDKANAAGGGEFHVASYDDLANGALDRTFDVAVANFALIGRESVDALVGAAPTLLAPGGALIIQTLHPVVATGEQPYVDGWRPGSWAGFSSAFSDPAPWYFRTTETWIQLLVSSGLRLVSLREPVHPTTRKPASLILVAELGD